MTEPLSFYSAWFPLIQEARSYDNLCDLILTLWDWPPCSIYESYALVALFEWESSKAEVLIGTAHWVYEGLPI